MEKILVSACLAGFPCRYDGQAKTDKEIVALVEQGRAIPICPEQIAGLTTPRPAVEIVDGRAVSVDGVDFTEKFQKGAKESLKLAQKYHCRRAILKSGSPSCGADRIYDGTFSGKQIAGKGLTARLFDESGIEIESR